ncbi:ATPase PAAT [Hyperolius riggenbachi]|uniref:ATPase PAAT n=1 Tax=Hyperolius riggenbachi TaxID=752182 RepID=UPI0035A3B467
MCPVLCSSSWLCQSDITSVLCVAAAATQEAPSRDQCVVLELPSPSSDGIPCTLSLCCAAQETHHIQEVSLCSEARTIEVYSTSQDGQEEEYLGTCRGVRVCSFAGGGEDGAVTLYKAQLTLEFPVSSCNVKLLSLGGRTRVLIGGISVQVKSVPERCPQMSPSLLGPSIDLERVQHIMDSMGGKVSPGAEQLMSLVRAQQQNQAPFGAHLLQLFGGFQRDRGPKKDDPKMETSPANKTPDADPEAGRSLGSAYPASSQQASAIDVKSVMSSFLQNQMGQTGNPESILPLLQNLHVQKSPNGQSRGESCVMPREEKLDPVLEKLLSATMQRLERNLMDHIDHKMKCLQEHLDSRINHLLLIIESGKSPPSSVTTTEKLLNGHAGHTDEEEDYDCDTIAVH